MTNRKKFIQNIFGLSAIALMPNFLNEKIKINKSHFAHPFDIWIDIQEIIKENYHYYFHYGCFLLVVSKKFEQYFKEDRNLPKSKDPNEFQCDSIEESILSLKEISFIRYKEMDETAYLYINEYEESDSNLVRYDFNSRIGKKILINKSWLKI